LNKQTHKKQEQEIIKTQIHFFLHYNLYQHFHFNLYVQLEVEVRTTVLLCWRWIECSNISISICMYKSHVDIVRAWV